jgi:hypothetical protein
MVNGYLSTGDIAPQIIFYNGPASDAYTQARWSFYGNGWTPTFDVDGVDSLVGWTPSTVQSAINTRLTVPCYLGISVNCVGNASGGTASYSVTAEQSLAAYGELRLYSAIVEDHDIATSGYGVYAGQELMWEPRAWPPAPTGTVLDFTGPYPQTLSFSYPYTLDPTSMTFSNLNVITYVQQTADPHEVMNASFVDLPDTNTGIGDSGTSPVVGSASLSIGPNPTSGVLNVYSMLPDGNSGNVSIFDINGRIVAGFAAGGATTTTLDTPGTYFVRMETSSGEILTRSCVVLR